MHKLISSKTVKVSSLVLLVFLSGCAATATVTDTIDELLGSETDIAPPLWANEPLLAGSQCDTLTVNNVNGFLQTYMVSQISNANAESAAKDAMDTYTLASVLVNRSQLCLAEALSLKEVSEDLLKEKEILLGGTSLGKKEIEQHREYSQQASIEIKNATAEIEKLGPEQQKSFVLGTATYLTGTYTTMQMKSALERYVAKTTNYAKNLKNGVQPEKDKSYWDSIMDTASSFFGDGKLIYNLLAGLPDHAENMYETGKYFIEYAQQENLELPADVTDIFNDQDW